MFMHRNLSTLSMACIVALTSLLVVPSWSLAVPIYQIRTNGLDVPLVLNGTGGHSTPGFNVQKIGSTLDGLVQVFDNQASGYEIHTLDPSLEEANNAVTGAAKVALAQVWLSTQQHYTASVSTATKSAAGNVATSGLTRALPTTGSQFAWTGGATATIREMRFEDGAGLRDDDSGEVATRATGSTNGGSAGHHETGLALIGETGIGTDVWKLTGGLASTTAGGPINFGVRKQEWGALTGLDLGTPLAGSRSVTVGGSLVNGALSATGLIADLVTGIGDEVLDMAYNPHDDNLYFISRLTGGTERVFLSAVSFEWDPSGDFANDSVATIIDLDPDAADTFLELTYTALSNPNDGTGSDLLSANSLTFSPDGTRLFVGNGPTGDRVFQFDLFVEPEASVPEPSSFALLGLGVLGLVRHSRRRRRRA